MVLRGHQHIDVSWETTPPIQGLEDDSLHPDLVLAVERWCTGLPVNLEPWLPRGEDFNSRVRRACAQIPWAETRTYGQLAQLAGSPKPVARLVKPCVGTRCLCSSPATVSWAPLVWVDTPVKIKMGPNLQESGQSWPSSKMSTKPRPVPYRIMLSPRLAQLARAARLHRVGRWFESSSADSWSMHARHCRTSPSP